MCYSLPRQANWRIRSSFVVLMCLTVTLFAVSCSKDSITNPPTIVTNPYGIEQVDIEVAYVSLALAQTKHEYLGGLGTPRSNPYGFTQVDIDAADSSLNLAQQRLIGLTLLGTLHSNPYGFSQVDIDVADTCLARAQQNRANLARLGSPRANPYEFSQADIEFGELCLEQAQQRRIMLINMLESSNYSDLDNFIPNVSQIDEARLYWATEKIQADSVARMYWQSEMELASSTGEKEWVELCDSMLESLSLRVKMIDTTLHGLDLDEAIIQNNSIEDAPEIAARKIAREALVINYYGGLIRVLDQAIQL